MSLSLVAFANTNPLLDPYFQYQLAGDAAIPGAGRDHAERR